MNAARLSSDGTSEPPPGRSSSPSVSAKPAKDIRDDVRDMERRSRLMRVVTRRIAFSELDNREIARRAGIPTQRISDLLAGRLEHFSFDDLQALRRTVEDDASLS